MFNLARITCLSLAALAVVPAYAVQVDAMSAWSSASEPLRMDVKLSDLGGLQKRDVRVVVASESAHERLGLKRPAWADQVYFDILPVSSDVMIARAMGNKPVTDDRVNFVIEIQAGGVGLLQQVSSGLNQSALAAKPAAVTKPAVDQAVVQPTSPVATVATVASDPRAKTFDPSAPKNVTKPAAPVTKPATKAVAAVAPTAASAPTPVAEPVIDVSDRQALEQGLAVARAQVADLEAQLAKLDAAVTAGTDAAIASAAAVIDSGADVIDGQLVETVVSEAAVEPEPVLESEAAPEQVTSSDHMKSYDLFSAVMMVFVFFVLVVLALFERISRGRPNTISRR